MYNNFYKILEYNIYKVQIKNINCIKKKYYLSIYNKN